MPILQLQNISKKYQRADRYAVSGVSLNVEKGEILALVGESGSGKTTLLRIIAGLEHPDGGKIILSDQTIVDGMKSVKPDKRKVGMVFQDYALFPHLSILENVRYGIKENREKSKQLACELLEKVGLRDDYSKYPHQLSGGQQQRVALARTLAPGPQIILLDEPFSNLDKGLKNQVREELRQIIKKFELTAIFVTHDTEDALSTSDKIAVLKEGILQQTDTSLGIYNHPVNDYVANFFGKMNRIEAKVKEEKLYTDFGVLLADNQIKEGQEYLIRFRPEQVSITEEPSNLGGVVKRNTFYGSYRTLSVQSPTGLEIELKLNTGINTPVGSNINFRIQQPILTEKNSSIY
jgi:iron(III) transport system ATP-binding protein